MTNRLESLRWEWCHNNPGKEFHDVWGPFRPLNPNDEPPLEWPKDINREQVVCAALLQEGVAAWSGDATSIVAQMIEAQMESRKRLIAENERLRQLLNANTRHT